MVSPDGRWIAYLSTEAGAEDVYIQSFPIPGHKTRVSSGGASRIYWMPGSDEIRYRTASRNQMMSVKLTRQRDALEVGEPRIVFRFPSEVTASDVSHDGQRVVVTLHEQRGAESHGPRHPELDGALEAVRSICPRWHDGRHASRLRRHRRRSQPIRTFCLCPGPGGV